MTQQWPSDPVQKLIEERRLIREIMKEMALPFNTWFLNGSGALAMHGVQRDRPMGDLDVFAATDLWFWCYNNWNLAESEGQYKEPGVWTLITPNKFDAAQCFDPPILRSTVKGLTVDLFLNWRRRNDHSDFDPAIYLNSAINYDGVKCARLELIMEWKRGYGRAKDLMDVIAIRRDMGIPDSEPL